MQPELIVIRLIFRVKRRGVRKLSDNPNHFSDRDTSLEILMEAYGEEIIRLCYTYVKNWSIAEDVTQEVFLTVYKKQSQFKKRSSIKTWIYTIAINKCKDYLRTWHHKNTILSEFVSKFIKSNQVSVEEQVTQLEEQTELTAMVMELPLKYREVVLLHYYKDFSIKEISQLLGCKESTIKSRLFRARALLKVEIGEEKGGELRNG
jgi:RNA polymerase sigma-70 factor, ECF subfamily